MPAYDGAVLPARPAAWIAYAIAGLATLLWIGCALPSGLPEGGSLRDDAGTPLYRQPWALVPALVLLVLTPAAMTLATGRQGRLLILAMTDAFVALYGALVLTFRHGLPDAVQASRGAPLALLILLYVVAGLSVVETRRLMRGQLGPPAHGLAGARLALCLLVLLLPAGALLEGGQERASLLAPFLFIAVSAGGARLSSGAPGLGLTAALLHLALATHVVVTLRFTWSQEAPRVLDLNVVGTTTRDLAYGLLALAALHVLAQVAGGVRRRALAEPAVGTGAPGALA